MNFSRTLLWLACALALTVGCDSPSTEDAGLDDDAGPLVDAGEGLDAGRDAGTTGTDAGPDAGPGEDSGVPVDAGPEADAGPDAGVDSGGVDAGPLLDAGPACTGRALPTLMFRQIVTGLDQPLYVAQAPGSTDTLWVAEKEGRIRLVRGGAIVPTPFLDLDLGPLGFFDERGLLGLAFHPDYVANGRFFVRYTDGGRDVVLGCTRTGNPDIGSCPAVGSAILNINSEFSNHNGGMIEFGADGFLYVALGDGGSGDDPNNRGQDPNHPLGTILRLDVDAAAPYAAAGNPFAGGGGDARVWHYGLRNPWRFSFDRDTGDMWIGDVGQNRTEEIDFHAAGTPAGLNYGWRCYEGVNRTPGVPACSPPNHVPPILEYAQSGGGVISGRSVVGGYVYRGTAMAAYRGYYLFTDATNSQFGALRRCPDGSLVGIQMVAAPSMNPVSFGEDNAGELYVVDLGGRLFQLSSL